MNLSRQYLFLFFLLFVALCAKGQHTATLKTKEIFIAKDTLQLDTFSLIDGSLSIENVNKEDYCVDYLNALLIINNSELKNKNLRVQYRTYPFHFGKKHQHKSADIMAPNLYGLEHPFHLIEPAKNMDNLFSDALLNSYGSISRGISMGNSQDMIVNSNMNLQLSGKLSEDLEILANITDQNIPIQPEGNTAQLKEFDKVFIQLKYKDISKILAGDIVAESPEAYFMKFTKKGQGLQNFNNFYWTDKKADTTKMQVSLTAAVAKGTFVKQEIVAVEGNQGPYQLHGKNNETFITVLAGSENVYIDEVLLQRGETEDYIINYNSGEITFTSKQIITKDKRIVVMFEYTDQNYLRSVVHFNTQLKYKKWSFRFNFYNEQDHKNQTNSLDLTNEQKQFLSQIGDNIDRAFVYNMTKVDYQTNEVLYRLTDTTINGVFYDSVFVHCTNPDSTLYRLGFSLVGNHNGDYILTKSTVNGRVYAWVAPIDGVPQGNYAPVQLLPTPQKKQMYSLFADWQISKNTLLGIETALSNKDINTFSPLGDKNNIGFAFKTWINNTTLLGKKDSTAAWKMGIKGFYETKSKAFAYIEDYKDLDFSRNYNLSDSLRQQEEHYFGVQIDFMKEQEWYLVFSSNADIIPSQKYMASQNALRTSMNKNGFIAQIDASLLNNRQRDYYTLFAKNKEIFSKEFKYITVGIENEMEINLYRNLSDKSIRRESFAFNQFSFFLKNASQLEEKYRYGLNYLFRIDANGHDSILGTNSNAHQVNANFDFLNNANHQLRFNASYRYLNYQDSIGENTLLTNLSYQARWWKSAVVLGLFYEIGSGLEQKQEYSYLRVADGQGIYQWIDYNGNGIEELNEFEIAKYKDEANYNRIWLTSNQYIKTHNNQFSASLVLRPMNVWRTEKRGFKKFLARFANSTTFRTTTKNTLHDLLKVINPFLLNISDTALVHRSSGFRNAFSFNQTSSIWGIDIIYNNNNNKILTVNGLETSTASSVVNSARVNIKMFTINMDYTHGLNTRKSEYINKNYKILYNSIEGKLSFQYNNKLKISSSYTYAQKNNRWGEEVSIHNNIGLEINYRIAKRGNLTARGTFVRIDFKGESNSSVGYELLEALQPGNNGVFVMQYQTTLWKNLQLNLAYEGRIAAHTNMKHLGSVELRAFF